MADRSALLRCDDAAVAEAVHGRLTADGLRVTAVPAATDPFAAVAEAAGAAGTLHVLVCAVGQPPPAPFPGNDPQRWYADVMACLDPAFRLVRAAAPALRRSGAGRLVFLGSGWTVADRPGSTAAAAAQGALVALTKTLARDLGPDAVAVNQVVTDPEDPPAPAVVAAAVSYLCGEAAGSVVGQLVTLGRGGQLRP
ncbi:short subunit dehydrogenase [Geodermatophilus tzadiensis]|uniref:Short subunit dehydrogenase n=1 Tax=Geodermatophilus tzadiensis TaxID=1137988 RepID=A0A2T0TBX6_9ACTN|nr:SDR family oxidoreductase [Geodermatophilus tzadiensis]PRY43170.1 short subunit dehydrogenase [Geodermatophilus tzadiensis]